VIQIPPLDFFAPLRWLDGRPLLATMELYRRKIFTEALYSFDPDGRLHYDRVLAGRAKKNFKTADLVLAGLYKLLAWESPAGNDCIIVASDEGQAADDLSLVKKMVLANPILNRELRVLSKEVVRIDGRGSMVILPANDVAGSHGKTFLFCGHDEIHTRRDYNLFEALSPDPTRRDVVTWITSYNTLRFSSGVPLFDMLQVGKAGTDPRLYFSWYAADYTTDPDFAGEDLTPEQRANPSMASWDNPAYLDDQRARLPTSRYRRLHLNLPGSPDGAAFSAEHIAAATVAGRRRLTRQSGIRYIGAVDMSGGSNDDSTLSISHKDAATNRAVLDLCIRQAGRPPFDPRKAVEKFADAAAEFGCHEVHGDAYGGQTFRQDFLQYGITYKVVSHPLPNAKGQPSASDFYEALEPKLNAGEVELLDVPELTEQLLTLVWRGSKIDHESGGHDDFAASAAIALVLAAPLRPRIDWLKAGPALIAVAEQLGPRGGNWRDTFAVMHSTMNSGWGR
jgi:hypothetical protein